MDQHRGHHVRTTNEQHKAIHDAVLDAIGKHPEVPSYIAAHAIIQLGTELARDTAPTVEVAEKLINLACTPDEDLEQK